MRTSSFTLFALILLLTACGSVANSGPTSAVASPDPATTVASPDPATTVPSSNPTTAFSELPEECRDQLRMFLRDLEPSIEGLDIEHMTQEELDALATEIEAINASLGAEGASCPEIDLSSQTNLASMREFAEQEAPGTVPYFAWLEELYAGLGGSAISGDCETDIAAVQEFIDRGGTMDDLTTNEIMTVVSLLSALDTECGDQRLNQWFDAENVPEWMGMVE